MINKMLMAALALSSAAVLSSANAFAADECSGADLKGHYTYWLQGANASGKAYAEVGQEHYDGAGNVISKIAVAGTGEMAEEKGTYVVNGDCSGTVTYASGSGYNIFVAPGGDSFVFSSTKDIQAGENTRVSKD